MFRRLSNSWELTKASAGVLAADKELIVFPIISSVLMLVVSAGFVVPMFVVKGVENRVNDGPATLLLGLLFYTVTYFCIFFCNSALVGAALIRLRGGDPTVNDGFRIAFGKTGLILQYALISATVGMVLRAVQERAGLLGRIVVGLFGMAWNLATFLAVPVMVSENVGPLEAIKRSTDLLKRTWGEQVVGNFGVGAVTSLVGFGLTLIFVPLIVLAGTSGSTPLIIGTVVGFVASLMVLGLISATLSGIYTAALYRYAAEGTIGEGFASEMVERAFLPK
jgi:Family of unknown function (DUF6159)